LLSFVSKIEANTIIITKKHTGFNYAYHIKHPSSNSKLLVDGNASSHGSYWVEERNINGRIVDAYKVVTDPLKDAQEYAYSVNEAAIKDR
jgi:hypothetical protein